MATRKKGNGKASGNETANIAAIIKRSENGHTNLHPMLFTHLPQLTY